MVQLKKTGSTSELLRLKQILALAVPISVQSLFQYSLSVIDQVMVGQLGTNSIAAVGLGSNFPNIFIVTLSAIGTAASIMTAQYFGVGDRFRMKRALTLSALLALFVSLLFFIPSFLFSPSIIQIYTSDNSIIPLASDYLRMVSMGYFFLIVTTMISALLRNTGKANIPMAAGVVSVALNTLLNYLLIFGKFGFPALGILGSAAATTLTRLIECVLLMIYVYYKRDRNSNNNPPHTDGIEKALLKQTLRIASPIVLNEFLWGVGTTVYSMIYGRMSTENMAAMTLTNPIQCLSIGLFSGLSAAAAILVGNQLGKNDFDSSYYAANKILRLSIFSSAAAGCLIILFSNVYLTLFPVEPSVQKSSIHILCVFALLLFVKVGNMIVGGGILRCGGKTTYTLYLDLIGTWGIGIPLGLLAAFLLKLDIQWVYLAISVEEIVRLFLGIRILRSKQWMNSITENPNP